MITLEQFKELPFGNRIYVLEYDSIKRTQATQYVEHTPLNHYKPWAVVECVRGDEFPAEHCFLTLADAKEGLVKELKKKIDRAEKTTEDETIDPKDALADMWRTPHESNL